MIDGLFHDPFAEVVVNQLGTVEARVGGDVEDFENQGFPLGRILGQGLNLGGETLQERGAQLGQTLLHEGVLRVEGGRLVVEGEGVLLIPLGVVFALGEAAINGKALLLRQGVTEGFPGLLPLPLQKVGVARSQPTLVRVVDLFEKGQGLPRFSLL